MARRDRQAWEEIVEAYEASGLSQEAFSWQRGLPPSSLRYWLSKLRQRSSFPGPARSSYITYVDANLLGVSCNRLFDRRLALGPTSEKRNTTGCAKLDQRAGLIASPE